MEDRQGEGVRRSMDTMYGELKYEVEFSGWMDVRKRVREQEERRTRIRVHVMSEERHRELDLVESLLCALAHQTSYLLLVTCYATAT